MVKKLVALGLAVVVALSAAPGDFVPAKAAWSISHTKRTIKSGQSKKLAIKDATEAQLRSAKWKVVGGSDVVTLRTNKKKSRASVTAKKAGTAKIRVSIGDQKKICTIKVVKAESGFETEATDTALTMLRGLRSSADSDSGRTNTLISPDSILSCMTMAAAGAGGATASEFKKLFGTDSIEDYGAFWKAEHERLTAVNSDSSKKVSYNVANSIWVDDTQVTMSQDFLNKNKKSFDAEIFPVKFGESAVIRMNSWVEKNTNKMIPKIIERLEKDDVAVLLNAIAFEGQWGEQYQDNQVDPKGTFTTASGKKQTVTMLTGDENSYLKLAGGTGFIKYYRGGDFAFFAYLPPEDKSVDDYLKKIDGAAFIEAYNKRSSQKVITKMPEFSYDYSTSLKKQLQSMGMTVSFSDDADFRAMLDLKKDPTQKGLKISDVLHKTHIEVDRNGTKAAAATAVVMAKLTSIREEPEPVYVTLDRPFVYGILDTLSGMPLFIGTLDSVE